MSMPEIGNQMFPNLQIHTGFVIPVWLSNFSLKVILKMSGHFHQNHPPWEKPPRTSCKAHYPSPRTAPNGRRAPGQAWSTVGNPLRLPVSPPRNTGSVVPNHPAKPLNFHPPAQEGTWAWCSPCDR